jgi:hypothetical protein
MKLLLLVLIGLFVLAISGHGPTLNEWTERLANIIL